MGNIDLEANNNKNKGSGSQALGNITSCCSTRTAIIVLVGIAVIVGIILGVVIGVPKQQQQDAM